LPASRAVDRQRSRTRQVFRPQGAVHGAFAVAIALTQPFALTGSVGLAAAHDRASSDDHRSAAANRTPRDDRPVTQSA